MSLYFKMNEVIIMAFLLLGGIIIGFLIGFLIGILGTAVSIILRRTE